MYRSSTTMMLRRVLMLLRLITSLIPLVFKTKCSSRTIPGGVTDREEYEDIEDRGEPNADEDARELAAGTLTDLDRSTGGSFLDELNGSPVGGFPAELDGSATDVHPDKLTDMGTGNGVDVCLTEGTSAAVNVDPVSLGKTAPVRRGSSSGSKSPSDSTRAWQSSGILTSKGEIESSLDELHLRRRHQGRKISAVAFRFFGRPPESEESDREERAEEAGALLS